MVPHFTKNLNLQGDADRELPKKVQVPELGAMTSEEQNRNGGFVVALNFHFVL